MCENPALWPWKSTATVFSGSNIKSCLWKWNVENTVWIQNELDVFHQRNLSKIMGVTWKGKTTNTEVLAKANQRRLQFQFVGHIIRMTLEHLVRNALDWIPTDGKREWGRPRKMGNQPCRMMYIEKGSGMKQTHLRQCGWPSDVKPAAHCLQVCEDCIYLKVAYICMNLHCFQIRDQFLGFSFVKL